MTTLDHECAEVPSFEHASAVAQWRQRVLLVGGGFQVVFGAWWLVRALAPLTSALVAFVLGVLIVLGAAAVTTSLLSSAPRPRGTEARRIERRLSLATLVQLAASVLVPWGLGALGWQRLSIPFVMATIALLLVWIHHEVAAPFQATAGVLLLVLAVADVALSGKAQSVVAGLGSASVLLTCASLGYHWLEHHGLES
jgi:hypothetical protein